MLTIVLSGLFTAALSILGKLATQSFFEAVLIKVVIWGGEKLVPLSTNTLDDEILNEVKKRLQND